MSITPLPPADFLPEIQYSHFTPQQTGYTGQSSFRFWCQTVLPLTYDDSLSYYELLSKVVTYINNIIEDTNKLEDNYELLNEAFILLQSYVNNYFDSLDVQEEINQKLDQMASDGTLARILTSYLGYTCPEFFGAKGDYAYNEGTYTGTDDSTAFADTITYAHDNSLPILLTKSYLIENSLTLPSRIRFFSYAKNDDRPLIVAGENLQTLFVCPMFRYTFEDFTIISATGDPLINCTAFDFNGSSNHNIDSNLRHVTIYNIGTGIKIDGRNILIENCQFSHNNIGVHFTPSNDLSGVRGFHVENCIFHGVGEDAEYNYFQTSSCIKLEGNVAGNYMIRNCTSEQSATFVEGFSGNLTIRNNFVEAWNTDDYERPIIKITPDSASVPANEGAIAICDNFFTGKNGSIEATVYGYPPSHIIDLKNIYRVLITGNVIKRSGKELLSLDNCKAISVTDNFLFAANEHTQDSSQSLIKYSSCQYNIINNNVSGNFNDLTKFFYNDGQQSSLYATSNQRYYPNYGGINININPPTAYGTINAGVSFDLTPFAKDFVLIDTIREISFFCHYNTLSQKFNQSFAMESNTVMNVIDIEKIDSTHAMLTVKVIDFSTSPPTVSIPERSYRIQVYE